MFLPDLHTFFLFINKTMNIKNTTHSRKFNLETSHAQIKNAQGRNTVPPSVLETRPANWAVGAFIPSGGGNAVQNLISSSDRLAPCNKEKQLQTNNQEENEWHIEKLVFFGHF